MKIILMSIGIVTIILLTGCIKQPKPFNKNNKKIVWVDGKPFHIPYQVSYRQITPKGLKAIKGMSLDMDLTMEKESVVFSENCKLDNVWWIAIGVQNELKKFNNKKKAGKWLKLQYMAGKMNCAKELSDREYKYYLSIQQQNAQLQNQQNIQNQKNKNAASKILSDTVNANAPKTHNVNVYHY